MALRALTLSDTFTYVSDEDVAKVKKQVPKDPDNPKAGTKEEIEIKDGATVFTLKSLDVFLMGYIYDNASMMVGKQGSDEVGIRTRINQTNLDAVRFGLVSVTNFPGADGNDVSVKHVKSNVNGREYDAADDATVQRLGLRLIAELAGQIKEKSEITREEEKN